MNKIKLSARLQAIALQIPRDANVADIGTDHGYIPVWLAQNQAANKIVAADINIGPLNHAKQTAKEFGVEDRIRFELSNGLQFASASEFNTIIIAGMGGELIASILSDAPWTKNDVTLILQPNSRIEVLVEWLMNNGYFVENAVLTKDAGKYYQILIVKAGDSEFISEEAHRLVHPVYLKNQDPLLCEYLDNLLYKYKSAERGMLSGRHTGAELDRIQTMIHALEKMREEAAQWQL